MPRTSRLSLATRLAALRTGRPQPDHVLTIRTATTATIEADRVVPFAADGDVLCVAQSFEVRVRPAAVRVLR